MFTQFFGNYLVQKRIITQNQLIKALDTKNKTRIKLGTLAMANSYLTAENVNKINSIQKDTNQKFGDIAIKLGYLTKNQIEKLSVYQSKDYLVLGQSLIDNDFITNEEFINAFNDYKNKYSIYEYDLTHNETTSYTSFIDELYNYSNSKYEHILSLYTQFLFNNLTRFIGDDFTPIAPQNSHSENNYVISQELYGDISAITYLSGDKNSLITFAKRFLKETVTTYGEYERTAIGEFININNGLFSVNLSNDKNFEIDLMPQEFGDNFTIPTYKNSYSIPVLYPFGKITMTITIIGVKPSF